MNKVFSLLRANPFTISTLFIIVIIFFILIIQGLMQILGSNMQGLKYGMAGGLVAAIATSIGALPALFMNGIPQKIEDAMLGWAAGMMLAASAFSLLIPGISAAHEITGDKMTGVFWVTCGLAIGVVLMLALEKITPHIHTHSGTFGINANRMKKIWLFVFAIILHNLPEGMAIGVSFSQGDLKVGIPTTTAISLQDIPEGLAIALAMRSGGYSNVYSILIAVFSGLVEPVGAFIGITLSSSFILAYPIGLGLAAGAMIFVVSHEIIPETHRNGHQTFATIGLMVGFATMMILDNVLG